MSAKKSARRAEKYSARRAEKGRVDFFAAVTLTYDVGTVADASFENALSLPFESTAVTT